MSSSRIPSPARSQGIPAVVVTSPRPRKSRRSRSVCSATSNTSLRLTAVIPDSFQMSPLAVGVSVLNDDTDIQIPGRQSWWKKLGTNSRDVTEIIEEQEKGAIMTEEFDVEILSQEKENMSVDLPDSSDCESIQSIVIPQRKLFAEQDNRPQKKLKVTVNSKESLVKMRKSYLDHTNIDKDIDVMPKKLFNQAPKPKTKPVFTAALLNASANKTVNINKSIKQPEQEVQGQIHNLFGNRPGTKRKNIYAEFLVSDSEDEIPEIQPRVFGLQKKLDHQQASKQPRTSSSQVSVRSSISNMTDVEIDDWQHLPSSTMVEHQLEDPETSLKRTSLSRLSRPRDSDIASIQNNSINKSKRSYSKIIYPESEEINKINHHSQSLNRSKDKSKIVINNNKSLRESIKKNTSKLAHDASKNKTLTEENIQADLVNKEHEKTLSEENQHSDEIGDENFTLEYENEDDNFFNENGDASQNKSNKETYDNVDPNKTDKNSQKCNNSHIILEITEKQSANVEIDNNQNDNNLIEKSNQSQTELNDMHEEVVNEVNKQRSKENESKQGQTTDSKEQSRNLTTGKSKNKEVLMSPEAVLHNKSNRGESFTKHGRHTSMSKSKTMIKDLSIRPSLAPARESTGLIDGTINSSAEGSGWDSHRTTRKTLRQTFGKDFTPRKSLRTLVMERAAKRQTNQYDHVADRSKRKSNFNEATDKSKGVNAIANKSIHQTSLKENANLSKRQTYFGDITNKRPIANSTELPDFDSYQEQDEESDNEPKKNDVESNQRAEQNEVESDRGPEQNEEIESDQEAEHNKESEQEVESNQRAEQNEVESDREPEQNEEIESDQEAEHNKEAEQEVESNQRAEQNEVESDREPEQNEEIESDQEAKNNKESEQEVVSDQRAEQHEVESDREPEQNEDIESDQEAEHNKESEQEVESDQEAEHYPEVESDQEAEQNDIVESDQEPEQNEEVESDQDEEVESDQEREQSKEVKSNQEAEHNTEVESEQEDEHNDEVESEQEAEQNDLVESNQEPEQNEEIESDQDEEVESDQEPEQSKEVESDQELEDNEEVESDQEVEQAEEVESEQEPEKNEEMESDIEPDETEEFESYREPEPLEIDERDEQVDDEASKQSRLAALQMFLQKVKLENAENRRQIQEKVMNSLKVPRQPINVFKMPEVPKPKRATKTIKQVTKTKLKPSLFSNELPPEFFEDLKYKPPKRFQGKNAPWITKRLYKFLEDKLRPKYDYHARVRAEKLVETLYLFAKDVRKCARAAPPQAISELKREMARLGIVETHYHFYSFFHEFMPREIRIRVNPDIMNKIPKPRDVFGNIIEETHDDE